MAYGTAAHRGDPGFFGSIGKVVRTAAGIAGGALPFPFNMPGRVIAGLGGGGGRGLPAQLPGGMPTGMMPGGGGSAGTPKTSVSRKMAGLPPKRRRMNVTNDKALRRAIRRTDGFVKLAKRALKGTAYTVSRRGASRGRKPTTIIESGPGSVYQR